MSIVTAEASEDFKIFPFNFGRSNKVIDVRKRTETYLEHEFAFLPNEGSIFEELVKIMCFVPVKEIQTSTPSPVADSYSDFIDSINRKINCFSALENDWDGYSSARISTNEVIKAKSIFTIILKLLSKKGVFEFDRFEVLPTPSGSVQFEIAEKTMRREVEIELIPNKECMQVLKVEIEGDDEHHEEISIVNSNLSSLIDWLI